MARSQKGGQKKMSKSSRGTDRTDEAIDWINSVGADLLDAGASEEDLVELSKSAVLEVWPNASFDDEILMITVSSLQGND